MPEINVTVMAALVSAIGHTVRALDESLPRIALREQFVRALRFHADMTIKSLPGHFSDDDLKELELHVRTLVGEIQKH